MPCVGGHSFVECEILLYMTPTSLLCRLQGLISAAKKKIKEQAAVISEQCIILSRNGCPQAFSDKGHGSSGVLEVDAKPSTQHREADSTLGKTGERETTITLDLSRDDSPTISDRTCSGPPSPAMLAPQRNMKVPPISAPGHSAVPPTSGGPPPPPLEAKKLPATPAMLTCKSPPHIIYSHTYGVRTDYETPKPGGNPRYDTKTSYNPPKPRGTNSRGGTKSVHDPPEPGGTKRNPELGGTKRNPELGGTKNPEHDEGSVSNPLKPERNSRYDTGSVHETPKSRITVDETPKPAPGASGQVLRKLSSRTRYKAVGKSRDTGSPAVTAMQTRTTSKLQATTTSAALASLETTCDSRGSTPGSPSFLSLTKTSAVHDEEGEEEEEAPLSCSLFGTANPTSSGRVYSDTPTGYTPSTASGRTPKPRGVVDRLALELSSRRMLRTGQRSGQRSPDVVGSPDVVPVTPGVKLVDNILSDEEWMVSSKDNTAAIAGVEGGMTGGATHPMTRQDPETGRDYPRMRRRVDIRVVKGTKVSNKVSKTLAVAVATGAVKHQSRRCRIPAGSGAGAVGADGTETASGSTGSRKRLLEGPPLGRRAAKRVASKPAVEVVVVDGESVTFTEDSGPQGAARNEVEVNR
jgi:hypothetical protein